jgi:putative oxidoreductase
MATLTSPLAAGFGVNTEASALTPAQNTLALLGRVLIAVLFLPFAWQKITNFSGTVQYIISAGGVPLPEVAAAIGLLAELVLPLLLVGYQARWAALLLAIYVVVLTPIFHHFWSMPEAQVFAQKTNFFKNCGIAGGLLAFAAFGPGAFSIDAGRKH